MSKRKIKYLLKVLDNGKELKIFKIVKLNMNISNPTDAHWLCIAKEQCNPFTIVGVKAINHNTLLIN